MKADRKDEDNVLVKRVSHRFIRREYFNKEALERCLGGKTRPPNSRMSFKARD